MAKPTFTLQTHEARPRVEDLAHGTLYYVLSGEDELPPAHTVAEAHIQERGVFLKLHPLTTEEDEDPWGTLRALTGTVWSTRRHPEKAAQPLDAQVTMRRDSNPRLRENP